MRLFISCVLLFFVLGCDSFYREVDLKPPRFQAKKRVRLRSTNPNHYHPGFIYVDTETDIEYVMFRNGYKGYATRLWKRDE